MAFFAKKPDVFNYEVPRVCKCCSTGFQGRFCTKCGEKVIEPGDRSLLSFFNGLISAVTSLDGKLFRSLKLLAGNPGQLSRNIAGGIQAPYMKMLSLFFVANFFYFLFPILDSFNSSLYSQTHWQTYSEWADQKVNERIVEEKVTLEEFTVKYNEQSTDLAKLLVILLVFMFAASLSVINYSQKVLFFDHLLLSLEFYSFLLIFFLVLVPYLCVVLIKAAAWAGWDWRFILHGDGVSTIGVAMMAYFLVRAQRNFYTQKWFFAVLRTAVLIYLVYLSVVTYRAILFYITMWTV